MISNKIAFLLRFLSGLPKIHLKKLTKPDYNQIWKYKPKYIPMNSQI